MSITISGVLVAFGSIYLAEVDQGVLTQLWSTTEVEVDSWSVAGPSLNTVVDIANNHITVNISGLYQIDFQISYSANGAGMYSCFLHINGVKDAEAGCARRIAGGGGPGSMSFPAQRRLTAGDVLSIMGDSDVAPPGQTVTYEHIQFVVRRIGQ